MAEKKKFDLGSSIAAVMQDAKLGPVSDSDTMTVQHVPLDAIDADKDNFYAVEGVESLASNIELVGLQQPILVRRNPDDPERYIVVSGHRRRAALQLLVKEGKTQYADVPVIVERPMRSAALQELALIYGNADSRDLSSYEINEQAKRVEELLVRLRDAGVEFPGRMRDHVAEVCKKSASKLARLKAIDRNLDPSWAEAYRTQKLPESTAYCLSKLDPYYQQLIHEAKGSNKWLYEGEVERLGKKLGSLEGLDCKFTGRPCTNLGNRRKRVCGEKDDWLSETRCERCCDGCGALADCRYSCPELKDKAKAMRDAKKLEKQIEEQHREEAERPALEAAQAVWTRFGEARRAAGKTIEESLDAIGEHYDDTYLKKIQKRENGETEITTATKNDTPYGWEMRVSGLRKLRTAADLFGCSVDYLIGRTEDLTPWSPSAWINTDDRYPDEGEFVFALDRTGTVIPSVYWGADFMDSTVRSVANKRLSGIEYWMPRPAPPTGIRWTGEEVLREMLSKRD